MDVSKPDRVTLVLGGARSGKSRHAEGLVMSDAPPWLYVATGQAYDDEMRARIAAHQAGRGEGWVTVEAPLDLVGALRRPGPLLVDCLTLWLTNVMLSGGDVAAERALLLTVLRGRVDRTVLVSNEVGLGIVPDNALARAFRDAAGVLHQEIAGVADRVVLMVAGIAMVVK